MSSSADIVTRALKRLKLLEPGETPAAEDAADGLAALNAMIAGWDADGLNVSPDVPLGARHEEGVVALLAVRLAEDYGKTPGSVLIRDADMGYQRLQNEYFRVPTANMDSALTNMPSQRIWVPLANTPVWQPAYAYSVSDRVQWRGNTYECTTAGTSASTRGPIGYDSAVSDGTVVWQFKEAV
jgi:hypothetical protein